MELLINNTAYKIPERLGIDQWKEVQQWDFEEVRNWPRIIHIVTGAPYELLRAGKPEALELGISIVLGILQGRKQVEIADFNKLRLGEWIDLDIYITEGVDKKIREIIQILSPGLEWADEALWVIEQYIQWRASMYRTYQNLFGIDEADGEPSEQQQDPQHIARTWYRIIVGLAGDNILNLDQVVEQPLIKAFNFMALQKQQQLEENAKILQQKRTHDLQRTR